MRVSTRTIGPSNDTGQHTSAGVGGQSADQLADQVIGMLCVVVWLHAVVSGEQLIGEFRCSEEEVLSVFGDNEVLRENFQHLLVIGQRLTKVVVSVAESVQFLP